ncbi:MAG: type I restriction endonuclease [Candidatus Hodarchaeota archaeon]
MNEATFEGRLHAELRRLFPTIAKTRISHQQTFTLRLGHHEIFVDGASQFKTAGRLDVLVKVDGRSLVLLELKRPKGVLTEQDRDQGISYARLLTPMPPLVVVSNGTDTRFYKTYDKKQWEVRSVDDKAVQSLFRHSLESAAQDKDEAIKLLLGQNPGIWKNIILKQTQMHLENLLGGIADATRPVAKNFTIPRSAVSKIISLLLSGESLIILVGPPLSGKTNVVAQLCMQTLKTSLVPFYLDAESLAYGVIQHLSNVFCRNLFFALTPEKSRQWLLNGLRNPVDGRLVIIIDGWSPIAHDQIRADVDELISLGEDACFSIVLSVDQNTFERLHQTPGRSTATAIGRKANKIQLDMLNDEEFEMGLRQLYDMYKITFHSGAFYNKQYRQPQMLRILAAEANAVAHPSHSEENRTGDQKIGVLPSVTGLHVLNVAWDVFTSIPELRADFLLLANAYIADRLKRESSHSIMIFSYDRGCISIETAEKILGTARFERLRNQGYLSLINGPEGKVFAIPKVPEMLSVAGAFVIADELANLWRSGNYEEAYAFLLRESEPFPIGDVVGAKAIIESAQKNSTIITDFVDKLLVDGPTGNKLKEGSSVLMNFPDVGEIRLKFGEGMDEKVLANVHPWLVLSQLAGGPIWDASLHLYLQTLATVGAFPGTLRRVDTVGLKEVKGFHIHDIPGNGSVVCGKMGIVEPITQAMLVGFYHIPEYMVDLSKWAAENDVFPLVHRLSTASNQAISCGQVRTANAAKTSSEILSMYIDKTFKEMIGHS